MVFLGIDPGTRNTGVAAIEAVRGSRPIFLYEETLRTPRALTEWDAIWHMTDMVYQSIRSPVGQVAIEDFSYQGHEITREAHDTYLLVGALGELRKLAPVVLLKAGQWKADLTGLRAYSDRMVEKAIRLRLAGGIMGPDEWWSSEHAIDATGIAIVAADRFFMAGAALVRQCELRSNSRRARR